MAITLSKGYGGQVGENDVPLWARALGGLDYGVLDAGSWKVSAVPSVARTVQAAAGTGMGRGIYDESSGGDQVEVPNPPSGQLWHAIVVRRDTSPTPGGLTTFGHGPGAAGPWEALAACAEFGPSSTVDEQPLALVRVAHDVPAVQEIIDVRCWQANGGAFGASDYVRGYLNRPGTCVRVGTVDWVLGVNGAGTLEWLGTGLLRPVNVLGAGPGLTGTPPPGATIFEQAGSLSNVTDSDGFAEIVFPVPFPTGLLTVVLTNGDSSVDKSPFAADVLIMSVAGAGRGGIGTRSSVRYALMRPRASAGGLDTAWLRHRVNYIARGW